MRHFELVYHDIKALCRSKSGGTGHKRLNEFPTSVVFHENNKHMQYFTRNICTFYVWFSLFLLSKWQQLTMSVFRYFQYGLTGSLGICCISKTPWEICVKLGNACSLLLEVMYVYNVLYAVGHRLLEFLNWQWRPSWILFDVFSMQPPLVSPSSIERLYCVLYTK